MEGTPAKYLGRLVSKPNFRAFIYACDGTQCLVESWDEFEAKMQTGLWFASKDDASASIAVGEEHPKKRRTKKSDDVMPDEEKADEVHEVKDDFLPKD